MSQLLQSDEEYLLNKQYEYTIQSDGFHNHLIVKNYRLPNHYDKQNVDLLIKIPVSGYPFNGLDMFWVSPHVRYTDGRTPQNADVYENILGVSWQRFSRHYQWQPGIDSLATHMSIVHNEFSKKI